MLTLATSSYWLFLKTNMKTEVSRDLQQEMRFALTRITDRMRAYSIDYEEYSDISPKACSGYANAKACFTGGSILRYDADPDADESTEDGMLYLEDQPLFSPKKINVTAFYTDFSPRINPYKPENMGNLDIQIQPKATFFIEAQAKDKRFKNIKLQLQTTISSRKYSS